jgi:hypothetical protein
MLGSASAPDLANAAVLKLLLQGYRRRISSKTAIARMPGAAFKIGTIWASQISARLNFLLLDDITHCSRTVSCFWWEPLLGTLHFQPKQAIEETNFADSAREFN